MSEVGFVLFALSVALVAYAYVFYPVMLRMLDAGRQPRPAAAPDGWPSVSITVPVHNERAQIRAELESLLALDYPPELRQILVISDASDDGTDAIVEEFADRGVELLRLPRRGGKTAAENAARGKLRGEVVVNTDASIRIAPSSLKRLVEAFSEPQVGLASGRDVSVADLATRQNVGESGYVGYEMAIRRLETRAGGIIGASGCFFAVRAELHREVLPNALSRDFASPLVAFEHGYRSVSVDDATCFVARTATLRDEYRRKVRTMARGMETLMYKRRLLNPFRYGRFAWMLFSHKICRWLVPWAALGGIFGLVLLSAAGRPWAGALLAAAAVLGLTAAVAHAWPAGRHLPSILAVPGYIVLGNIAAVHASFKALRGELNPVWEPTQRDVLMATREG